MKKTAIIAVIFSALGSVLVFAQPNEERSGVDLSRSMRMAVQLYEQGEDLQAMDRFMEILTKGAQSERSMANEYINLITHHMNTNGSVSGAPAAPARMAEPRGTVEAAPSEEETPVTKKAMMRKAIRARLRSAAEKSLADIKAIEGVRVVMRANGDPEAIGIPAPLLFQSGISFRAGASEILDPLTKLVFSLGTAQAVILPEGAAVGDAKIMDMRRTMGISSHFFNAGIAPPRVRVNLLNTQVDIPKSLTDFTGVVIVFVYNQPLNLVLESAVGDELGPPLSLGVYPSSFRPSRGQGVIVEFSVSEPPAGLVSWKFQLRQPSRDGAELAPIQDVSGGGPVFHQIFWNGKQNYFGETLPPGRYECVLTALDVKNRQRSVRRWIQVLDDGPGEKMLADKAPALAPSADMAGAAKQPLVAAAQTGPQSVELLPRSARARVKRQVVTRPVRGKKAGKADKSKAAAWVLNFNEGTYQLTPDAEKLLATAAAAIPMHPLENLRVTGHSGAEEAEGAALAEKRAKMVASILVNRYQLDSKRIFMTSSAAGGGAKVDLAFTRTQ